MGARLCGQASRALGSVSATTAALLRVDFGFRRHGDQRDPEPLGIGDEVLHLRLLAGPGQRDDHVVDGDHAEIAVARFGGVDEEGGGSGRGEGGGDLARHMPGLAEPGDDHATLRLADQVDGGGKRRSKRPAQRGGDRGDAAAFGVKRAQRRLNGRVRVVGTG